MVTTFTYKPSLVRIDVRNFELSWSQTHKHTNKHKQTNPQTEPITIHCAAKLSAQCNNTSVFFRVTIYRSFIRSFHSRQMLLIAVSYRRLAGKVGHRDQLIICNHAYLKTPYKQSSNVGHLSGGKLTFPVYISDKKSRRFLIMARMTFNRLSNSQIFCTNFY